MSKGALHPTIEPGLGQERDSCTRGAFSFFPELHPKGERGLRGKSKEKSAPLVTLSLLPWGTGNSEGEYYPQS